MDLDRVARLLRKKDDNGKREEKEEKRKEEGCIWAFDLYPTITKGD